MVPLMRLIARLPLAWLHSAGAVLGWLVYRASPVYAARMRENLAGSGIYADDDARERALRLCIAETGKGVVETAKMWFGDLDEIVGLVEMRHLARDGGSARRRARRYRADAASRVFRGHSAVYRAARPADRRCTGRRARNGSSRSC